MGFNYSDDDSYGDSIECSRLGLRRRHTVGTPVDVALGRYSQITTLTINPSIDEVEMKSCVVRRDVVKYIPPPISATITIPRRNSLDETHRHNDQFFAAGTSSTWLEVSHGLEQLESHPP
ncbi:hypothetical protein PT974_10862 [Cladobotryum mycophilum]|uniref:Uncharacterized protein n=1 Tax=Cladobotryum mycophilum TaxID=491253 RepID=A0ABR0SBK7_9HYPO